MTNNTSIQTQQMAIVLRNGIEVWVDLEKAKAIKQDLESGTIKGFMGVEGRTINSVDITGILFPEDIEDMARRRNGEWKCRQGNWHDRGEKCVCLPKDESLKNSMIKSAIQDCEICGGKGVVIHENYAEECKCLTKAKIKYRPRWYDKD